MLRCDMIGFRHNVLFFVGSMFLCFNHHSAFTLLLKFEKEAFNILLHEEYKKWSKKLTGVIKNLPSYYMVIAWVFVNIVCGILYCIA